jgi:hypothetical protein
VVPRIVTWRFCLRAVEDDLKADTKADTKDDAEDVMRVDAKVDVT